MKKYFIYLLFLLAFIERVFYDLGPNFELITAASVLGAYYLNRKTLVLILLTTIATTDLIMGNTNIALFTWSGFLIPAIASSHFLKGKFKNQLFTGTGAGIVFNLFFYLWTNFGVWLLDSWGMYSNDFSGLLSSYVNALPFLRFSITSTAIFIPFLVILLRFAHTLSKASITNLAKS